MSETNSSHVSRSMRVVGMGSLFSKVLGMARDTAFACVWGTGVGMAGWATAFMIPNLFRALFGEGVFNSAFVPVFSDELVNRGKDAAWRAACRIVSVLTVVLGGLTFLAMLLCVCLLPFVDQQAYPVYHRALQLAPMMLPYALLVCVAGALAGVLNSFKRFTVPALTPLLLNLLLILAAGAAWLISRGGGNVQNWIILTVPAVLLAGGLHIWLHLLALRRRDGLTFCFAADFKAPEVRKMVMLMAPAIIGTAVIQLNSLMDRLLAGWLGAEATCSLYYSQRLIYFPVGLFGVAAATVLLPSMSKAWATGDKETMLRDLRYSFRHVWFLSLPMAVMIGWLGRECIDLLFGYGNFTAASAKATWWALIFYAPGIPLFALVKPAASAFHAQQDVKTPMRIAWVCMGLNLVLNLALMWTLRQAGLALATTLSSLCNLLLLQFFFRRRTGLHALLPILPAFGKVALASALMIPAAWGASWALLYYMPVSWNPQSVFGRALLLLVPMAAGYLLFLVAALLLRCEELREILRHDWVKLKAKFKK